MCDMGKSAQTAKRQGPVPIPIPISLGYLSIGVGHRSQPATRDWFCKETWGAFQIRRHLSQLSLAIKEWPTAVSRLELLEPTEWVTYYSTIVVFPHSVTSSNVLGAARTGSRGYGQPWAGVEASLPNGT